MWKEVDAFGALNENLQNVGYYTIWLTCGEGMHNDMLHRRMGVLA